MAGRGRVRSCPRPPSGRTPCDHRHTRRPAHRRDPGPSGSVPTGRPRTGLRAVVAPGASAWRPVLLLPPAALSLLGAGPVGRTLLPLAVATAVLAVALAVLAHRSAAERARWTRHVDAALAAARTALDADLARRVVELERSAIAELDAAAARRRAAVDGELTRLAVDPVAPGG